MINKLDALRDHYQQRVNTKRGELEALTDTYARARVSGQLSGLVRKYRQELCIILTTWAVEQSGRGASKFKIQKWQIETFGQAVANQKLAKHWCDPSRTAGERADFAIGERLNTLILEAFASYRELFEQPHINKLDQLKEHVLGTELGL